MIDVKLEMLLQELSLVKYQTALDIAEKLNVSEKTIRTRIKDLNETLKNHGARIISKQRFGIKLEIVDEKLFQEFSDNLDERIADQLPSTLTERVPFILDYLLDRKSVV